MNGKKQSDHFNNYWLQEIKFAEGKNIPERIKLMGVEWTAEQPNYGFAEPESEIIRHGKLMKSKLLF